MTFLSDEVRIEADEDKETPAVPFSVTYNMACDKDADGTTFALDPTSIADNDCSPRIRVVSKQGCALIDVNGLWRWVEANWWVASIAS